VAAPAFEKEEAMNDLRVTEKELFTNPAPRLAVAICADASGSMRGQPIEQLNEGLGVFWDVVKGHDLAKQSVEVAVVAFGGTAQVVQEFGPILATSAPHISLMDGGTSLGSGVALCLDLLEQRKAAYKQAGVEYYQPWIVLMSDGQPTDETHEHVAPRIGALANARKLTVFPIGVGDDADLDALALLSPRRPPLMLKGLNFVELFEFLGKSVQVVSASQPGDTPRLDTAGIKAWAEV
jgi:uncharacterized protein YegL